MMLRAAQGQSCCATRTESCLRKCRLRCEDCCTASEPPQTQAGTQPNRQTMDNTVGTTGHTMEHQASIAMQQKIRKDKTELEARKKRQRKADQQVRSVDSASA